ncbi:MAG: TolB family protein, partial [Thermoanaerobaculia bacterium]
MTKCSLMTCVVLTCAAVLSADGVPNDWFPRWSPDGKRIVFMSDRSGDPEIYVTNADGSHAVRLTSSPGRDAHPTFSSDGRRIAFQSPRGNGQDVNIYEMRADGEQVIPLTEVKGFAGVPSYAPDDKTIVFQWRPTNDFLDNEKWRICMMNADGGGFREITNGEATDDAGDASGI